MAGVLVPACDDASMMSTSMDHADAGSDSNAGAAGGFVSGMAPANGTELYFEEQGVGETVVLLHGLTLDARIWDDQFAALAKEYHVVRFDQRGHGRSGGVTESFSQPDDLAGLLEYLQVSEAHLVGLSMGGFVSYQFALEHPAMVKSLVLVDSAREFVGDDEFETRLTQYVTRALGGDLEGGLRDWFDDPLFAPARTKQEVEAQLETIIVKGQLALGENAFFAQVLKVDTFTPPAEERLAEINAPTLVLIGELDLPPFQKHADLLAARIPGATKQEIEGSGHMSSMEQPAAVTSAILEFLRN